MSKKKKIKKKHMAILERLESVSRPLNTEKGQKSPLEISHERFQKIMKKLEQGERLCLIDRMLTAFHLLSCRTCPVSDKASQAIRAMGDKK